MGADPRKVRSTRLTIAGAPVRICPAAGEFVRLSHLRKIRECEQVAAVCYRVRAGSIEFLLVRTRGSGRWTFPKGSTEPGLTHAQAAALEAFEEAGVHGRIEEAALARYIRRKRDGTANPASRSGEKRVAVNAHLCEVLRLSTPKESKRNRTWFSVDDARQNLREGRKIDDGDEFARVVDQAVARIHQLYGAPNIVDHPQRERTQQGRPRADSFNPESLYKDGLQKVQFDFAQAYGRVEDVSLMPYIRRQTGGMRRFASRIIDIQRREVLPCEVLEFSPLREKKARALGTGTKNG
jgi:8-oxo-dGTP pyrophosphatase MutT (NUDIX family)